MAQPAAPWNHYTYPLKGAQIPGVVVYAGMFTTDSSGNVTSVSGIAPGMTVSGTSLSSGIYTVFFGDGPNINQVGNGVIGSPSNTFPGGSPNTVDSFNRVLYLHAASVTDNALPQSDMWKTTQKDSVLGQGKLQYLKSTVTTAIASGNYVSTAFAPAVAVSQQVEVFAVIWTHKDVT